MSSELKWEGKGKTDVGRVRSVNQDSILLDNQTGFFIVADGMGGHAGGEIASGICVNQVSEYVRTQKDASSARCVTHPCGLLSEIMSSGVNEASARIYERALEDPPLKGMGTTATALQILEDHAYVAHVGDSRLYLIRCGFIYQMTMDHSLVNEQVRAGIITQEEADEHHLKNVITRSVGYQEEEYVDTHCFKLQSGDLLLLCSDGLHGLVGDQDLSTTIAKEGVDAVDTLVKMANSHGGDDNISAVVVKIL